MKSKHSPFDTNPLRAGLVLLAAALVGCLVGCGMGPSGSTPASTTSSDEPSSGQTDLLPTTVRVEGRILDGSDGRRPVTGAIVKAYRGDIAGRELEPPVAQAEVDSDGHYVLPVQPGFHTFQVQDLNGDYQEMDVVLNIVSNGTQDLYLLPDGVRIQRVEFDAPRPDGPGGTYLVGSSYDFGVRPYDPDGNLIETLPNWTVEGGIGFVSSSGLFRGTSVGPGQLVVLYSSLYTYPLPLRTAAPLDIRVAVEPSASTIDPDGTVQFSATVTGALNAQVVWSVEGGPSHGVVTNNGLYTAPAQAGTYTVVATSAENDQVSAAATVTVRRRLYLAGGSDLSSLREFLYNQGFQVTLQRGLPSHFGDYDAVVVGESSGVQPADAAVISTALSQRQHVVLLGDVPVRLVTGQPLAHERVDTTAISSWFAGVTEMDDAWNRVYLHDTSSSLVFPAGLTAGDDLGSWSDQPAVLTLASAAQAVARFGRDTDDWVAALTYTSAFVPGRLYWQWSHSLNRLDQGRLADDMLVSGLNWVTEGR